MLPRGCLAILVALAGVARPAYAGLSSEQDQGVARGLVAVLELQSKLKGDEREAVDAAFFGNEVRQAALEAVPGLRLMTRENVLTLLAASGKKLEDCEGECEVETGRRLGADFVVSGEIVRLGTTLRLGLRLHDTKEGRLLAGASASGKGAEELDAAILAAVQKLLVPLGAQPQPAQASQPAQPSQAARPPDDVARPPPQEAAPASAAPARIQGGKIEIHEQVYFKTGSFQIMPESIVVLDQVAGVLRDSPALRVAAECHSDNVGADAANVGLTQRRAEAIVAQLLRKGVDSSRLEAHGFGPSRPIDSNRSPEGRARNRRCELRVLDQ